MDFNSPTAASPAHSFQTIAALAGVVASMTSMTRSALFAQAFSPGALVADPVVADVRELAGAICCEAAVVVLFPVVERKAWPGLRLSIEFTIPLDLDHTIVLRPHVQKRR